MSVTLVDKIKADAEAEVAKIKEQAAKDVVAVEAETKRAVASLESEATEKLEKEKAQQTLVATSKAKQTGKLSLQRAKRQAIDQLFADVCAELTEQDSAAYVAFFTEQAKARLPKELSVESVRAPKGREAETTEILKALDLSGETTVDERLTAGFILEAKDGVYDLSFDRIVNERRPEIEIEIMSRFLK